MGFVSGLLTSPLLGPIRGSYWLASKVAEAAEAEFLDEGKIRGELLELQMRLDIGESTEAEYAEQEKVLMERLNTIREVKAERHKQG